MWAWIMANWAGVAAATYVVVNEIIAIAPNLQSNSIVQLVVNILKSAVTLPTPPKP